MRIGLQTWGSEGDVRPFLALAAALSRRGHGVRLVITEIDDRDYARYADTLGVDIEMVASPVLASEVEIMRVGDTLLAMGSAYRQGRYIAERLFEPGVPEMFTAARDLAGWSDVIVRHYFHHPCGAAADLAGVPQASLSFSPDAIASADQPPGDLPDLGSLSNRFLWKLARRELDRTFLPPINRLREQSGLAPLPNTMRGWYSPRLNVVAVSPFIRPPSADWAPAHRVSGFLNLPESQRFDPLPETVDAFLEAGEAPVFVGFGSLTPRDSAHVRETLDVIENAVSRAGCRAIVQGLAEPATGTSSLLHVGRVPHAKLFPRCAAIVHHAGAGTTQTATLSGVPSVCVPHLADQFYWSRRLYKLGTAVKPLKRKRLTARRLAGRLADVLGSEERRERAQSLAARMSGECGDERAADLIESLAESRPAAGE